MKYASERLRLELSPSRRLIHPLLGMFVPWFAQAMVEKGHSDSTVRDICRTWKRHKEIYLSLGWDEDKIPGSDHLLKPSHAIDIEPVYPEATAELMNWEVLLPWLNVVVHDGKDGRSTGACYHLGIIKKFDSTKITY